MYLEYFLCGLFSASLCMPIIVLLIGRRMDQITLLKRCGIGGSICLLLCFVLFLVLEESSTLVMKTMPFVVAIGVWGYEVLKSRKRV